MFVQKSPIQNQVELKSKKLHDEIAAIEKRLQELEDDPVMRIVHYNAITGDGLGAFYMGCRYIAAAKEKDPFLRKVKKPFVSDDKLR